MASGTAADETPEGSAPAENPPRDVEQADEELQEQPMPPQDETEDELGPHGEISWSALAQKGDRARERSRSPLKGASLPAEVPQASVGESSMPSGSPGFTAEQAEVLKEARENPKTALEVLHACTELSMGITSLVASLKATHTQGIKILKEQSQTREDLARALDLVAKAIGRQAGACESLVASVNSNTSRVGAVAGETSKVRTWLAWAMPRPLTEGTKKLEQVITSHGEQSEKAMQELAAGFSTELQSVGNKIILELQKVTEAIQRIGVEPVSEQPEGVGNPFGLESTSGEGPAILTLGGYPPQMPSTVMQPPPPPTVPVQSEPCPPFSAAPPTAKMTPVTLALPVARPTSPQLPRSGDALPCVFVGFSPKEAGGTRMTCRLPGAVAPGQKQNPLLMQHADGTYLLASPTARQGTPAEFVAPYSPCGWVILPPSKEIHRVYAILNRR